MDPRTTSRPTTDRVDPAVAPDEVTLTDLIEDVSIDGMCGVY